MLHKHVQNMEAKVGSLHADGWLGAMMDLKIDNGVGQEVKCNTWLFKTISIDQLTASFSQT